MCHSAQTVPYKAVCVYMIHYLISRYIEVEHLQHRQLRWRCFLALLCCITIILYLYWSNYIEEPLSLVVSLTYFTWSGCDCALFRLYSSVLMDLGSVSVTKENIFSSGAKYLHFLCLYKSKVSITCMICELMFAFIIRNSFWVVTEVVDYSRFGDFSQLGFSAGRTTTTNCEGVYWSVENFIHSLVQEVFVHNSRDVQQGVSHSKEWIRAET